MPLSCGRDERWDLDGRCTGNVSTTPVVAAAYIGAVCCAVVYAVRSIYTLAKTQQQQQYPQVVREMMMARSPGRTEPNRPIISVSQSVTFVAMVGRVSIDRKPYVGRAWLG